MTDVDFTSLARVGPVNEGDGNETPLRTGKQRELITTLAHGRFYEAASRGAVFFASTGAAGVAPGTTLSTTPPMALWNPLNSGRILAIQQVYLGYVSGTLGAGSLVHGLTIGQTTIPTGGAELTPQSGLLANVRGVGRAFQGSTLVAAPTILRPSVIVGAALATTATFPAVTLDEVDGSIVVPPGAVWAYQGIAAAGTTPLVLIGVVYEETPIA